MADEEAGPVAVVRLRDFAAPYLDAADVIADLSGGLAADLGPELGLPPADTGRYLRSSAAAWTGDDSGGQVLLIIPVGPDPARQLPLPACEQLLARLPAGGQALLLLGYPPAGIPGGQLAGSLAAARCLLGQTAALAGPGLPTGLAVARLGWEDAAGQDAAGEDAAGEAALPALRAMNERRLASFQLTALQARLGELEQAGLTDPELAALPPGWPGQPGGDLGGDRDRLARALRAAHRDAVGAHEELAALERSATVAIGRAIATAARRPWPGAVRLPGEAYRLWRDHRGRARAGGAGPLAPPLVLAAERGAAGIGDRWLAAYTVPGQAGPDQPGHPAADAAGGLVITGVLTSRACATLAPDAVTQPLLPHNADFVLEATGADLVLIQASALLPGTAWSYAADPAAPDRGRRLAALVSLARSLGKPVILLRDAPRHLTAGMDWLADRCDGVCDADLGVQLARFNPIGLAARRPCDAVYAGERSPREPALLRQVLDELTDGPAPRVTLAGYVSWREAPRLYREHGLFLAATAAQAREQLASGAMVVGPPGPEPPEGACAIGGPGRAAAEIKAARDAGGRELAEIIPFLRGIFARHATPVRLAELARLAGLPGAAGDPSRAVPGRQLGVLAGLADPGQAGMLATALARQRLRPAEVVVSVAGDHRQHRAVMTAFRPLAAAGTEIRITPAAGPAAAAAAARSPWLAHWPPGPEPSCWYLLDLACARECSRADAVGFGDGPGYRYQPAAPALARRDLLAPGAPPVPGWGARGLRTLTVGDPA